MRMRMRVRAAGLALALSALGAHGAGKCGGDSAGYRIMPPLIGRSAPTAWVPNDMPCDSMIVPRDQTTIICGSSILDIGTGPGGKIVIRGKLMVDGKPGDPPYLVASIAADVVGFAPGEKPWNGIQADRGAILRISHARFYNASTPVLLSTRDLVLKNCSYERTWFPRRRDTGLAQDTQGQSLSSQDFWDGRLAFFAAGSDPAREGGHPDRGSSRIGRAGKWLAGGAAGVLAISGAAWWVLRTDAKPHASSTVTIAPSTVTGGLDAAPDLPEPGPAGP
jgi:hypothetical protein